MSTRKSTRISDRTIVQARELPGASTTLEKSKTPARKNQKTVAQHVSIQRGKEGKGRAGFMCYLMQMPLDILLGIFSLLEPIDLHHLLRVSKTFHDFLWLRTTAHVWRMAYENLPYPQRPPSCPVGVNIVFYTNFVFGIHCQVLPRQITTLVLSACAQDALKNSHWNYILKVEYHLRQKEMAQATKENTLSKYIEQRQQAINYRFEQASVLISWRNQMTRLANEARARMREQRENGIRVRLSTEACVPQYLWCQLYAVNFPQRKEAHELTDDEWRYIRADVIEYLFDHSENQLRTSITHTLTAGIRALDAVLQQFVVTRPRIAPTAFHVASSNPYLQMVKSSAADHTVNDVLEQVAQLPAFITGWRLDTDNYLASLIPQPRRWRSMDNDPNLLGLATSFFRCDMCTEPISYPRILMHHCFLRPTKAIAEKAIQRKEKKNTPRDPRPLQLITADTVLPSLSYTFGEGMHPDRAGVAFHQVASKSARMIILGCRENPDIITYGEMDLKDFRVECLLCSSSGRGRLVMRWTIAILHDLAKHSNKISSQTHWQLVDSVEDEEKIKAKETQMIKKSNMPAQYCCRLCDEKVMKNLVALHLSRVYRK